MFFIIPEIPYPANQEEGGVPEGDERVLAEEDRLRSHRRLGELREDDPRHARLQENPPVNTVDQWERGSTSRPMRLEEGIVLPMRKVR